MRPIILLCLITGLSCASESGEVRDAFSQKLINTEFTGPRELTVSEGSDEDVAALAAALRARGFTVVTAVAGVLPRKTRYVAKIDGVCGGTKTLHVQVFELESGRPALETKALDQNCPQAVFEDAATHLAKWWEADAAPAASPQP
jgi:hypothetical protein